MNSLWQNTASFNNFESLSGDLTTEVAIVGGGIVGVLTAYFLDALEVPYVLLEKDKICSKTTAHTTGKITVGHSLIYDKILRSEGLFAARAYYTANSEALSAFAELGRRINCDFEQRDNIVYSKNNRRKLEAELTALEQIGARADFKENLSIPIETVGAVRIPRQAQFNPLKFLAGISRGLKIYENTKVLGIDGSEVITEGGRVNANTVIMATHFPITDPRGLYFMKMYQHRSYVLALESDTRLDGMYIDEAKGGMSFRDYGRYLLLGGGGHRTGKDGGGFSELRAFAAEHYPNAAERFAWAAEDCITLDSIPYIGRYSHRSRDMLVATGFNKWGMSGAMLSAILLSDIITGRSRIGGEIFDPARRIFKPQLLLNIAESIKGLLRPTVPRCTHLGCALRWNSEEHTWDCPCHGSRFTENGEVIDSPANRNKKNLS